ncbi:hypothetical protein BC939DRAFT_25630 [Gamsiella multidivaricata]|uniref:uncharacterized protein n=1 Tax=Gamsiella multidivaricata TaxID=101098 RepID=UPI00222031C9|nr:uncharacterized protein BC939DRAFT_25630 [Gamsiella multidivaricata]KAG0371089.1 hypothetical protein BGZ54_000537 [Gamsiella multidivaricata]KAI7829409.1 hypothetical protein BC939DRAFT_25630 [Gamsiella multidivaricata]
MTDIPILSVLDIPELHATICEYLSPYDMAQCMATSKRLSRLFTPFFWRDIRSRKTIKNFNGIRRNLHHIRTVDTHRQEHEFLEVLTTGLDEPSASSGSLARNLTGILTSIYSITEDAHKAAWKIATLLQHNPGLTHLKVSTELLICDGTDPVFKAISKLRHLKCLHLSETYPHLSPVAIAHLLLRCVPLVSLSELQCDFEATDTIEEGHEGTPELLAISPLILETILENATELRAAGGSIGSKIKNLSLPRVPNGYTASYLFPILKSDLLELESFEIPNIEENFDAKDLENVVRKHCSKIQHLKYPPYYDYIHDLQDDREYNAAARAFIRGCTALRSFSSTRFYDQDYEPEDDEDLEDVYYLNGECYAEPRRVVYTLARRHADTLEELNLPSTGRVYSCDLQAVLSSCRNLKKFVTSGAGGYGVMFGGITSQEWVCLGLKELDLYLHRGADVQQTLEAMQRESLAAGEQGPLEYTELEVSDNMEQDPMDAGELSKRNKREAEARAGKKLYEQIGRLSLLEDLSLDCNYFARVEWDLTLSKGWLIELAGLKRLHHLSIGIQYWYRMGQAEVEFMDAHWPMLRTVDLKGRRAIQYWTPEGAWRCDPAPASVPNSDKLEVPPHWRWFQTKRPYLKVKME